ncbi:MAG: PaaI family thioesterase [Saprospiraceae bacterium]|nr:PaaI family thioesterase [Saprospiraceae bacterium]
MKTDYIEMLKSNIGKKMGNRLPGLGGWLNGAVSKISDDGDLEVEFEVREEMLNPMGNIHGGAIAAIVDEILGFQLFLQSEKDIAFVSMTMNIDFLRPAQLGDIITAIPQVVKIGRKTANVKCELKNASGKILALGGSNFMRVL